MKTTLKLAGIMTACIAASSVNALTLNQVLPSIPGLPSIPDNGAETYTFTDSGPTAAGTYLFQEYATFAPINKMGLYNPLTGAELELFDGPASPSSPDRLVFVNYDASSGTATANGFTITLGPVFGVYIDSSAATGGGKFYSQQAKNADGANHVMSFDVNPPLVAPLGPYNQIFAFEDLDCAQFCDNDFTDMVVGMTDVSAVPVPAAAWLFGSGIFGLASIARRRRNS